MCGWRRRQHRNPRPWAHRTCQGRLRADRNNNCCHSRRPQEQIHAGGRGKAGGVKLVKKEDIINVAKSLFGKVLVTPQTGPEGKVVKRIYVQKAYDIAKEFYLSCLVDRKSSKIAFISSTEGGVDIEAVAKKNPEKINTTKVDLKKNLSSEDINLSLIHI